MSGATNYTITPPSPPTGTVGVPSEPFTVSLNGSLEAGTEISGATTPTFQDTGLTPDTTYYYRVKVTDATGAVVQSVQASVTTPALNGPEALSASTIAARGSSTSGGTIGAHYRPGAHMTIVSATVGTNRSAGQSPTGYLCTFWDDYNNPGAGNALVPRPDLTGYVGAPCNSDGTIIYGSGLWLPPTAPVLVAARTAITDSTDVSGISAAENAFMADLSKGMTVQMWHTERDNTIYWNWNKSDGSLSFGLANLANWESVNDYTVSGISSAKSEFASPSKIVMTDVHFLYTPSAYDDVGLTHGNMITGRLDGSTVEDMSSPNLDLTDANRGIFLWQDDGGWNTNGASANTLSRDFIIWIGRPNKAQTAVHRAWAKTQTWASQLYVDTRDYGFLVGNSQEQPYKVGYTDNEGNSRTHLAHIARGYMGSTRIQRTVNAQPVYFTVSDVARSGNMITKWQSGFIRRFRECDFSDRLKVVANIWEAVNGSTTLMVQDAMDICKNAHSNVTVVNFNTRNNLGSNASYDFATDKALFVPAHSSFMVNLFGIRVWSATNIGNNIGGDPNGPTPTLFEPGRHPLALTNENLTPSQHIAFKAGVGLDISTISIEMRGDVDKITLNTNGDTYAPTFTSVIHDGTVNSAATSRVFISRDTSICTVHATNGVITRTGVGRGRVDGWDNTGGKYTMDVVCP